MGEQRAEGLGSPRATLDESSVGSVRGPSALGTQLKKVYPRSGVGPAARFTSRTHSFTCHSAPAVSLASRGPADRGST